MKKLLSCLLLSLVAFYSAVNLFSQETQNDQININDKTGGLARYYTMGAGGFGIIGGFREVTNNNGNNPFIMDPTNVYTNPAWLSKYPDMLSFAVSNGSIFGASFRLNDDIVVGVKLGSNNMYFNSDAMKALYHPGLDTTSILNATFPTLKNELGLFGSYKIDNITLGAGFSYVGNSTDNKINGNGTEVSLNNTAIFLGFLGEFDKVKLDIGFNLSLPSYKADQVDTIHTYEGKYSITMMQLNSRVIIQCNKHLDLIPFFNFLYSSGSLKGSGYSNAASNYEYDMPTNTCIDLGFGLNYKIGKFLLIGGPSLGFYSQSASKIEEVDNNVVTVIAPESSKSQFILPRWNIGAEWYCTNWFIARVGFVSLSGKETYKLTQNTYKTENTNSFEDKYIDEPGIRYGIGLRFGSFSIDGTISDAILNSALGNLGSGASTFGFLSASYAF